MGRSPRMQGTSSHFGTKQKSPFVFVIVADCTGTMSVGEILTRSGLDKFCLDPANVTDSTRCFFQTKITGDIFWSPKRDDGEQALVAARGTFSKVDEQAFTAIDNILRMSYATSDVMEQIMRDPYADISKFTTTRAIGRITTVSVVAGDGKVHLQLEDPVAFLVVELCNVADAQSFIRNEGFMENDCVIIRGELEITEICPKPDLKYACLKLDQEKDTSEIVSITEEEFLRYVTKICQEPASNFSAMEPTVM